MLFITVTIPVVLIRKLRWEPSSEVYTLKPAETLPADGLNLARTAAPSAGSKGLEIKLDGAGN